MIISCVKTISLFLLICSISVANAQEPDQELITFVNTATIRIATKLAEDEGKEKAEVEARIKAEKEAEERLKIVTKAQIRARQEFEVKRTGEREAKGEILATREFGIRSESDTREINRLKKIVSERAKAEQALTNLLMAERLATVKLQTERENRTKVEHIARERALLGAQQSAELKTLTERWRNNPTEDNLTDLSEKITAIATEQEVKAKVTWKSSPNPGALIFYQTKRARERGDKPKSITNPTETPEGINIGRYYVWAERSGKVTSNKERLIPIAEDTPTVTVVEDQ